MGTVQIERFKSKRVYLLFGLTDKNVVFLDSNIFTEARFALDHGKKLKDGHKCVDYSYVSVDRPPLFNKHTVY